MFYETEQDLLGTLVPFFQAGIQDGEACLWIVSDPLTPEQAEQALRQALPGLDQLLCDRTIEISCCTNWRIGAGNDNFQPVLELLHAKLAEALASGHRGLRVGRDGRAYERARWECLRDFENELNQRISRHPLTVLCTYPIIKSGAAELLDATRAHPVCTAVQKGEWEILDTPELKEERAEIKKLNRRLEQNVVERTEVLHAANEELRKQKEVLQKIFDHIPVMINFMDPGNQIKLVNREWERVLGWTLEEIRTQGSDILSKFYPRPEDRERVANFISSSSAQWGEFRITRKDGRELETLWACIHLSDGATIGFGRDITEQKRLEEQLRTSADQMRALSASIQEALEEERTRISRFIHDELGSAFASLKWDLESMDKTLSQPFSATDMESLRAKIGSMKRLVADTIENIRRIAWELRPSILDDLGLVEAIEWQARQFEERTGIVCHRLGFLDGMRLSEEQSTALFRIFQEALTNILRHSSATQVDITLVEEPGEFVLAISDNGRGITGVEKSGLGILGMQERVRLLGGAIEINGLEGGGTTIAVRIPLEEPLARSLKTHE
ncbi:MAG TPA: MEDS domain-containing protein [Bryobacteraceae bacterium]|nr:MEDS domain-containing protein [Bryobacteraceae bacterium]